ncbi:MULTISPECIES: hypothetical protein [Parabacteroides]|uniref:hypothetical protein n=1 Tax=Parabacteroides leei TaxID=2939491 RepID=UPI001E54314A|nr:hypothetical protein [Parabacteroides goldsteinii]
MAGYRIRIYLLGTVSFYLLCGCTAEPVIDAGSADARPVTLSFTRPDLGRPVPVSRAGDGLVPERLPVRATVRIAAYYLRKGADGAIQPASFDTSVPRMKQPTKCRQTVPSRPAWSITMAKR